MEGGISGVYVIAAWCYIHTHNKKQTAFGERLRVRWDQSNGIHTTTYAVKTIRRPVERRPESE